MPDFRVPLKRYPVVRPHQNSTLLKFALVLRRQPYLQRTAVEPTVYPPVVQYTYYLSLQQGSLSTAVYRVYPMSTW